MSSSSTQFAEHTAWLREVQEAYAAHSQPAAPAAPATGAPVDAAYDDSALPLAPEMWAHTGADDEQLYSQLGEQGFDYDSAPVYRSMDMLDLAAPSSLVIDDDDGPRYRGLGLESGAGPQVSPPTSAAALERSWLETMPPLVRRQRGASTLALGL